jgi:hypothetical protein
LDFVVALDVGGVLRAGLKTRPYIPAPSRTELKLCPYNACIPVAI